MKDYLNYLKIQINLNLQEISLQTKLLEIIQDIITKIEDGQDLTQELNQYLDRWNKLFPDLILTTELFMKKGKLTITNTIKKEDALTEIEKYDDCKTCETPKNECNKCDGYLLRINLV